MVLRVAPSTIQSLRCFFFMQSENASSFDLLRLRVDRHIIGYRRTMNNTDFFSKDLFWWNGNKLPFTHADYSVGFKTSQNRTLFENDIVEISSPSLFKLRTNRRLFRIVSQGKELHLIDLKNGLRAPISLLFEAKSVTFISYHFLQSEEQSVVHSN